MWTSDPLFGPDPGAEPIVIEQVERKLYCYCCEKEMLGHDNFFECPVCSNRYTESEQAINII